jgi:hypothetical protein
MKPAEPDNDGYLFGKYEGDLPIPPPEQDLDETLDGTAPQAPEGACEK